MVRTAALLPYTCLVFPNVASEVVAQDVGNLHACVLTCLHTELGGCCPASWC